MEEKRRVSAPIINKIKGTNEESRLPIDDAALLLPESAPTPLTLAFHACLPIDGITPSSSVVSMPDMSSIVNSRILANTTIHREEKTPMRVSIKAANRFGHDEDGC